MASSTIEPIDASLEHSIEDQLGQSTDHKSGQFLRDWVNCHGIQCLDNFYFYYDDKAFEHQRGMEYMSSPQLQVETCEVEQLHRLWKYMHYVVPRDN